MLSLMKKNRMRRTFIFILIAAILLTMQGFPVLAETAETEQLESGTGMSEPEPEELETAEPEPEENEPEAAEPEPEENEPEAAEPKPEENESEAAEPKPEENELEAAEPKPEENELEAAEPGENKLETAESEPEENKLEIVALEQSEDQTETPIEPSVEEANSLVTTGVPDDILDECIVPGLNPLGVIVNLFDYWQDNPEEDGKEVPHDYYYTQHYYDSEGNWLYQEEKLAATYDLGISRGHLLRFGYTNAESCPACDDYGQRGEWNIYRLQTPYPGIVKTGLGEDGFPVLNLAGKSTDDYQQYAASIDSYQTEESLAYLFSPDVDNDYKKSYSNVQGLFQKREDGSYYYNSTLNFASYDGEGSFILYNSPGVAEESDSTTKFRGQFFPFNSAKDVFNNYTDEGNRNYRLDYLYFHEQPDENAPDYSDYNSISDGTNGYMQCYAPNLNHYLGMTMEMQFLQPQGGYLANGADTPMTFRFSGDDDVWIFIDDVLVADLGGLHDACSLEINFATGVVDIQGSNSHTLLDSFQAVYGDDANPGGIAFHDYTFADNTVHTLKMFYLERGHMASNLYLDFDIQTLTIDEGGEEEPDGDTDEKEPDEDTDEKEPDEDTDEKEPDGDTDEKEPDGDTDEKEPDGDTDEKEPDGDTDEKEPDGDTNEEEPGREEEPSGNTDENVKDEFYPEEESAGDNTDENAVVTVQSNIPAADNGMPESINIPKTGDDSLIGWWAALSIISLLGIGATVCNLIITRKKQKM